MRLIKIDGINIVINMDNVIALHYDGPDTDGDCAFYIDGKVVGYFDSEAEAQRVMESIYGKFGSPTERIWFNDKGYVIENNEIELWSK